MESQKNYLGNKRLSKSILSSDDEESEEEIKIIRDNNQNNEIINMIDSDSDSQLINKKNLNNNNSENTDNNNENSDNNNSDKNNDNSDNSNDNSDNNNIPNFNKFEEDEEELKKKNEEKIRLSNLLNQDMIDMDDSQEQNSKNKYIGDKYNKDRKDNKVVSISFNPEQFFPWIRKKSLSQKNKGILRLHYEIIEFYNFIKPTKKENELFKKTFEEIKKIINNVWPTWKLAIYGSFATNLNLPDSDIDILILPDINEGKNSELKILKKIHDIFMKEDKFSYVQIINARTPIIKSTLKETNINIDISIFRKNGYASNKTVNSIINEIPWIRPLNYLIKFYLRQKDLNSVHQGGVSSFIIFNLLYAYIRYFFKNNLYKERNTNLGTILIGFFQFYGFNFEYDKVGISNRFGGFFYKRNNRKSLLSLENFQDPTQDIGRSCYKFNKVIECFKMARDALYYPSKYDSKSFIGEFITVDEKMKERYKKYKNENNK